ncbi:hypothetical protein [uncultured Pseudoalteromonas sp.]|uniref:hypothetical protein n=1 Tax=uncultured Pseudoalteromonas sp. TaxID=114053 RepID=UPI0025914D2F|nr:hypothetical protein [uncultured Pseudoalteromonas sp.]
MLSFVLLLSLSNNLEACTPLDLDKSMAIQKQTIERDLLAANANTSIVVGSESLRNEVHSENIKSYQGTFVMSKPDITYTINNDFTRLCGYWNK